MLLDSRKEEVIKLLNDGLSMERMAKSLGVSFTAVRNFLKKNGLETKAKHSVVNREQILELNAKGLTNRQISKITGVNENTVGKIVNSNIVDRHALTVKSLGLGIEVVSKINGRARVYRCSKGHKFERNTNNFLQSPVCPMCAPRSSLEEAFYKDLLGITPQIKRNVKIQGSHLELDFVIGNIAVELNGEYWHSSKFRDKYYHRKKYQLAKERGYTLLQFWAGEYEFKRAIVLSMIRAKLGSFDKKLFARNLSVKSVDKSSEKDFLNANHLQGYTPSIVALGLYNESELVALITFRNHKEGLEIARFCTKLGYQVVGGFSKLLKAGLKLSSSNIISYANARYSNGDIYRKAGFRYVGMTSVDFDWLLNGKLYNRRASWGNDKFENALKVYGTGNLKFVLERE
jgi:DNA-binding CsgD family transcriptional regulator